MAKRKAKHRNQRRAAGANPSAPNSRYTQVGPDTVLPRRSVAGKARAKRPGTGTERGQTLRNDYLQYVGGGITEIRARSDVNDIIKALMREEGIFSNAGHSMVSLASNSGYRIAGYGPGGEKSLDTMALGYQLMDRLDTLHDYSAGYNDRPDIKSIINTLMKDVVATGGCGAELVLANDFSPDRLVPIGYSTLEWKADGKGGRYPSQDNGDIELNIPTVFVSEYGRNASDAYATSILRPGLNNTIHFNEFLEDTQRSVNRVGHSRMTAKLITEQLMQSAPQDIRNDPKKMQEYMQQQYDATVRALQDLEPEDAIVAFDSVDFNVHDVGGSKSDYSSLLSTLGNLLGASLKTPASVTGLRAGGSQALSNAETLVYLQVVDSLRSPVEEVLSRALTLAVRLLGIEGYIKFEFKPLNLRPEDELEAYRSSKQKRILESLSYGLISDADACYELGIRPQGLMHLLSGTGFYQKGNQNTGADEAERESSAGRSLNPGTPSKSGGDDK